MIFSIIVPVYNVEKYIRRCLDSILIQTVTDFELVVVDDGSPDGCSDICDEYSSKDSRVKVVHQANGGLSSARNAGLNIATGKYACFIDSDDWVPADYLETLLEKLNQGFDMVSYNYFNILGSNDCIGQSHYKNYTGYINSNDERLEFLTSVFLQCKLGWEVCTRAFRLDIIQEHNLRFVDTKTVFSEDMCFSLCYCSYINKVCGIDRVLYYSQCHKDSIMGTEEYRLNAGRMTELSKYVLNYYKTNLSGTSIVDNFPVIHYLILNDVITKYVRYNNPSVIKLRNVLLEDIKDWEYCRNMYLRLKQVSYWLEEPYPYFDLKIRLATVNYLITGSLSDWLKVMIFKPLRFVERCVRWVQRKVIGHN